MNLSDFLTDNKTQIVKEATESLHRAQLKSYRKATLEENQNRIEKLMELTIISVKDKNLILMTEYAEKIAKERFNAGFDLHEVHAAFNVLEETLWKKVINNFEQKKRVKHLG